MQPPAPMQRRPETFWRVPQFPPPCSRHSRPPRDSSATACYKPCARGWTRASGAAARPRGAALLQALRAGLDAGGEAGPVHSAGLLIVREVSWPIVDLRVDWSEGDPVADL